MEEEQVSRVLGAIASPVRMKVLVLLIEAGPDGVASSDIADAMAVPRNLMSSHLAVLRAAGVIEFRRHGRQVIYTAVVRVIRRLGDHLHAVAARQDRSSGDA